MLSRDVVDRLSRLNRVPLEGEPRGSGRRVKSSSELPPGREIENSAGRHWLVEQSLTALAPAASRQVEQRRSFASTGGVEHPELVHLAAAFPEGLLFLDLETCGLAGSMVFLVGALHCGEQGMQLSQLLARHYAEERAVLQTLWSLAAGHRVLVTFNGKSFDWPLVRDRSTLHHLGRDAEPLEATEPRLPWLEQLERDAPRPRLVHCDLLHHCRRRWRGRLPNCKLQTLEQAVCGRRRVGDLPGREIPQAYHEFVRSGDAWELHGILRHNALDLVTLLELALRMLPAER